MAESVTTKTLKRIEESIGALTESINGNGKPGLKMELALLSKDVAENRKDINALIELEKERNRTRAEETNEREKERRAWNRAIALMVLGNIVTLVVAALT